MSKIPQPCLFNALSFKLGGAMPQFTDGNQSILQMDFRGTRKHYSVAYLLAIGAETQQMNAVPRE